MSDFLLNLAQFYDEMAAVLPTLVSKNPFLSLIMSALLLSVIMNILAVNILRILTHEGDGKAYDHTVKLIAEYRPFFLPLLLLLSLNFLIQSEWFALDYTPMTQAVQAFIIFFLTLRVIRKLELSKNKTKLAWLILLPIYFVLLTDTHSQLTNLMDSINISVGNIHFTLWEIVKSLFCVLIIVWIGKNITKRLCASIRKIPKLDSRTKELYAKITEVLWFVILAFLTLEIIGVDMTTLAFLGGAIGVGLGFGLQSITSNFISGIILLLDRSLSSGDHVELEDGRQGIVRECNMRSTTIETYDGKDIIVPNEKFISGTFVNWTHANTQQRYSLNLQVSYKTDLTKLFDLIRNTVSQHPQVLSGENIPIEYRPDAEISGFGDSGVDILIEFWMDGIDDGKNRVGADLLLMIWDAFRKEMIEIPYPQREVTILQQT